MVTTFRVAPVVGGRTSVTIDTTWPRRGPGALLERLAAPFYLAGVYKERRGNLEKVATGAL